MLEIKIIAVGSIKERYFTSAIEEYLKRMKVYANVEIIELGEERLSQNPKAGEIKQVLEKEADKIREKIEGAYSICLAIEGKERSSEEFARKIEDLMLDGNSSLAFIIGSSYGLADSLKREAKERMSFSKSTFPHQLMRVILLEQIYRAFKIIKNEPYHK